MMKILRKSGDNVKYSQKYSVSKRPINMIAKKNIDMQKTIEINNLFSFIVQQN